MTVHREHPFQGPDRDPVRVLRGRLGGAVTLWTTGAGDDRAGLTVSSVMVANGEPAHVLALVDPDADLAAAVARTGTAVVGLLQWRHRDLADAFAGVAPAPGGVFRTGTWTDSDWGPVLDGVSAWAGVRFAGAGTEVGWSLLLDGTVEHVEVTDADEPLVHRRGRYLRPGADG
ncbi:MAG: flavin reductase [Nocardioidaceae bacterium]|nr:flavin reductase [Nocardioidaceae bacterium]NUS52398.1 flavin reductase [Nocardioidaceae bacterium]